MWIRMWIRKPSQIQPGCKVNGAEGRWAPRKHHFVTFTLPNHKKFRTRMMIASKEQTLAVDSVRIHYIDSGYCYVSC